MEINLGVRAGKERDDGGVKPMTGEDVMWERKKANAYFQRNLFII